MSGSMATACTGQNPRSVNETNPVQHVGVVDHRRLQLGQKRVAKLPNENNFVIT